MTLPDICLQSIITDGKWWDATKDPQIVRGSLIQAFIPHVDQVPYTLEPVGRDDPRDHSSAVAKVTHLKVDAPLKRTDLPVAAMVLHDNEVWGAYRAKRRPCVVLGCQGASVDPELRRGKAKNSTAPTFIVAPYFGINMKDGRAGYLPEFVARVQQCEYPQFVWDHLPHASGESSLLRLDQMQPIGAHHDAYKNMGFRLSKIALQVIDEHLSWLLYEGVPADGQVAAFRTAIAD